MSSFQQEIMRHFGKQDSVIFVWEKKIAGNKTTFEGTQMLDIADKDFSAAMINAFKELNETIFKELKVSMMTMTHQIKNIIETEIIKMNEIIIL